MTGGWGGEGGLKGLESKATEIMRKVMLGRRAISLDRQRRPRAGESVWSGEGKAGDVRVRSNSDTDTEGGMRQKKSLDLDEYKVRHGDTAK